MAIKLEFINIIVALEKMEKVLSKQAIESRKIKAFGSMDSHLYREGCMNETDLSDILNEWEDMGFELSEVRDGQKHWKDVCVAYSGHGPSFPCPWLEYDPERNIVWRKGLEVSQGND